VFGELPDCYFADAVGGFDEGAVRWGGRVEGMRGKEEREGMVGRWRREREGGFGVDGFVEVIYIGWLHSPRIRVQLSLILGLGLLMLGTLHVSSEVCLRDRLDIDISPLRILDPSSIMSNITRVRIYSCTKSDNSSLTLLPFKSYLRRPMQHSTASLQRKPAAWPKHFASCPSFGNLNI